MDKGLKVVDDAFLPKRRSEEINEIISEKLAKTGASAIGFESCLDQTVDCIHEVVKYSPSMLSANHYDPDTTKPISSALTCFEELLLWKRNDANPFNMATVPLANREPPFVGSLLRTLVSHDMMGGYLDDRFLQGTDSEAPYVFYHWQYIDIFNYFTHNLVTIPPAVWTNAAHKNGVLVLGTFITEWTEGEKICEDFLKAEESYRAVADKLVQICHCYGFDGWLINIENTLSEMAVKNMPLFLHYLTDQIHERVPTSLILWYDSVLEHGELKWQNELNQSNRIFFDACDGIFTNYNWTEQCLERMKEYSAAMGRFADIYVGVDVFARGEVVGGKFETKMALELIRKHNFSTAIFAPGWVYESHDDKKEFRNNQDKFWALLSDFLYVHSTSSPLPFISSFCQGFGRALYWRGQEEMSRNWFNLNSQEIQPLYYTKRLDSQGWVRTRGCPQDAWNGGCSLLIEGLIPCRQSSVFARIFTLHVPLAFRTFVSLVYKSSTGVTVALELKTSDATICTHKGLQDIPTSTVSTEALDNDHHLLKQFCQSCGNGKTNDWTVRGSQLQLHGCVLREVGVSIVRNGEPKDTSFSCRVGEIMVLDASDASLLDIPDAIKGLCVYDVVWLKKLGAAPEPAVILLNATLHWHFKTQSARHFMVYWRRLCGPNPQIPTGEPVLLGRSYSTLFRVSQLQVPHPPGLLELLVQPVTREGFLIPESKWGRQSLSYIEE